MLTDSELQPIYVKYPDAQGIVALRNQYAEHFPQFAALCDHLLRLIDFTVDPEPGPFPAMLLTEGAPAPQVETAPTA